MKFIFKILGGFLLLLLIVGAYLFFLGTTDLRTGISKKEPNEEKAKALLHEMAMAHGISNWENIETYTVKFQDYFFGKMGSISHSYSEDSVQLLLNYIPKTYDGSLQFLSGERQGLIWGMQSWKTYVKHPSRGLKFQKRKSIRFWLPTYQYFIEFPLRIQKANALAYAGTTTINGINCEGVLASWNTTSPQREMDQYLIWLDSDTKRIVKLEYTIRDAYNFLKGAAYFNDYKNYEGIWLPSSLPVESNLLEDGFLHEMQILNFSKNRVAIRDLRPNRALEIMGDEKE